MKECKIKTKKFSNLFLQCNEFSVLLYFVGVGWFLLLSSPQFNGKCYFSENALIPGLASARFAATSEEINHYNEIIFKGDGGSRMTRISYAMKDAGMDVHEQLFSFQNHAFDKEHVNGTNVYGIVRARRASSTESLVINVPISSNKNERNYAAGQVIALAKEMQKQVYWAKDVVILFTEHGIHGADAWLSSYNDKYTSDIYNYQPLRTRAGSIQAGVVVQFMTKTSSMINVKVEGFNGQLPNLDLFNLVRRLSQMENLYVTINNMMSPSYHDQMRNWKVYAETTWQMMRQQAAGRPTGNHGSFLRQKVDAITIEGIRNDNYKRHDLVRTGRIIEQVCRSLNNLLERFHQSFFLYLLPSTTRYISIGVYMPPLGLLLAAPLLQVLCMHFKLGPYAPKNEQENDKPKKIEAGDDEKLDDGETEKQILPQLLLYDVERFLVVWSEVAGIMAFCACASVALYHTPSLVGLFGTDFDPKWVFAFAFTLVHAAAIAIGISKRFFTSDESQTRSHECLVIMLTIALGCVSVINFSLGIILTAFVVPPILLVGCAPYASKTFKQFSAGILLLAAPLSIAAMICWFNNPSGFTASTMVDFLVDIYQHDRLMGVWSYSFATLVYFPLWLGLCLCSLAKIS